MRATCAALILAVVAAASTPALAQPSDATVEKGIELYNDLEYEEAVRVLTTALESEGLDTSVRQEGLLHLALSHLALANDDAAREALKALLDTDRNYQISPTVSQKARDMLEELRKTLPPETVAKVSLAQRATPVAPKPGQPITVDVTVTDPEARTAKLVVHYRIRGQKSYSSVTTAKKDKGFEATISGAFVKSPAVEYYVTAMDAGGEQVASVGSAGNPLVLVIASSRAAAAPFYAKWWFWAGTTAVVAGVVAGVLLFSGDDPGDTSTVVITVTPPE